MKKLLLLLLLIPNLVLADYDPSKSFDPSKPYKVLAPEGSDPKNVTRIELQCAEAAGYSKNEYSAKKIEVSCLKQYGLIVYQENSDIFDEPYSELILLIFVILLFIGYKKIKDKRDEYVAKYTRSKPKVDKVRFQENNIEFWITQGINLKATYFEILFFENQLFQVEHEIKELQKLEASQNNAPTTFQGRQSVKTHMGSENKRPNVLNNAAWWKAN